MVSESIVMSAFATALIPIIIIILLGYILKRAKFLPETAWLGMEKVTYFVLFPPCLSKLLASNLWVLHLGLQCSL